MTTPKDANERLAALMDALAAQSETVSDQELLDDAGAAGVDVNAEANRVQGLLLGAVVRAKKERLADALAAHKKTVAVLSTRSPRIPRVPSERRALLMQTLQRRPQMKEALVTLQHRDFAAFSDADIESVLKQLDALGLLPEDDPKTKP